MGEKDISEDLLLKVEPKNFDMKEDLVSIGVCDEVEAMSEKGFA